MIKVIRIAGESFDFETKKETPKALVLSNGKTEFSLYVDDETAEAVLRMMLEAESTAAPAKSNGSSTNHRSPSPRPTLPTIPVEIKARVEDPPPMATVGDEPEAPEEDGNSESDPGEEYNDPATGAESL